jgi:hypothetical protein
MRFLLHLLVAYVAFGEQVSISPDGLMRQSSAVVRRASGKKGEDESVLLESDIRKLEPAKFPIRGQAIPSHIHFNHKKNFLQSEVPGTNGLKDNIKKIMKMHPGTNVSFFDDVECRDLIAKSHSEELALWFDKEDQGCYKSDLCRLAVLYEHGGYYFDNDFEVVTDVRELIPAGASISTVMALTDRATPSIGLDGRLDVFQAFLASSPQHPAIKAAMDSTLKWYARGYYNEQHNGERLMWWNHPHRDGPCSYIDPERCHQVLAGPVFVGKAIREWLHAEFLQVGHMDEGQGCQWQGDASENRCAYLFTETDDIKGFNLVERNTASGWPRCEREPYHGWCNIAVTDKERQMGWSRSPDAAEFEGFEDATPQENSSTVFWSKSWGHRFALAHRSPTAH